MAFPLQFVFSSEVTHEELDECFIDTRATSIYALAKLWTEQVFNGNPEAAFQQFNFDVMPDGRKYLSFLSQPFKKLDADDRIFAQVFPDDFNYFQTGLQNYVAILSHAINSAPGNDSNWPYGRYSLWDLDGNIGAKLISIGLRLPEADDEDIRGIKWGLLELHQLYGNLRTFGLNLSNFKDSLTDEIGPWHGFFETMTYLEESVHPLIDKVAIKQTVIEIVNKYIQLRMNSSLRDELVDDLMCFKRNFLSYKEIQSLEINCT